MGLNPGVYGNKYEDVVKSFFERRGHKVKKIPCGRNGHKYDLKVYSEEIKVEVKGCAEKYKNGREGCIKIKKKRIYTEPDVVALVLKDVMIVIVPRKVFYGYLVFSMNNRARSQYIHIYASEIEKLGKMNYGSYL